MNTFDETDLDEAFAQQATRVTASNATPTVVDEDMADAGDEKYIAAPRQGFIRPAKYGEVVRLSLLDPKQYPGTWKQATIHAQKGVGVFRCLNPKTKDQVCCKTLGDGKLGYFTLAVHYTNAEINKATIKKGETPAIELVPLKLSPYAYGDIRSLLNEDQENETIFSFDIVMAMESEQQIQGYSWKRASSPPRYLELGPDAIKNLLNPWADGTKLSKAIGKTLNRIEVEALLSKQVGSE